MLLAVRTSWLSAREEGEALIFHASSAVIWAIPDKDARTNTVIDRWRRIDLWRRVSQYGRDHPALWHLLQPPYRRVINLSNDVRLWRFYRNEIVSDPSAGNDLIREAIGSTQPMAIGRIGALEAQAARCYRGQHQYPPVLQHQLGLNVGLYPAERHHLDLFCRNYLDAVEEFNVFAACGDRGEMDILRSAARRPVLVRPTAFDAWLYQRPWSEALVGRRVLVVHPFAASIEAQYARREKIWSNPRVLPKFHLRTVRMPLSPGLVAPKHPNWQSRLAALIEQIDAQPYEVMLVGAGGLSILLARHAKTTGHIGFHFGGQTQILFGIMGGRWDNDPVVLSFRNKYWTRPRAEETPPTVSKVEGGAYW